MAYPLPDEKVVGTLRNVSFGMGRPLDEPAPPELAGLFLAWRVREHLEDQAYMATDARCYDRILFYEWLQTQHRSNVAYEKLARALKAYRHRCFVTAGHRFMWWVDTDGCRREYVKWEKIR